MKIEVRVPEVGESVQEALLSQWYKRDGDTVGKGDVLFVIETDKVTLEIAAEADGVLKVLVPEGATVAVGTVVGTLESQTVGAGDVAEPARAERQSPQEQSILEGKQEGGRKPMSPAPEAATVRSVVEGAAPQSTLEGAGEWGLALSPSVKQLISERHLDASQIRGTGPGGRLTKGDVLLYLDEAASKAPPKAPPKADSAQAQPAVGETRGISEEQITRKPMTRIRQRIAERLLEARRNTAMLTTFNEIDMSRVMAIRSLFKEAFKSRYGVSLGFMSFFIKACVLALKEFPEVNASIEGKDMVYHHYTHIGVAVGADKGLVVPVIRHADQLNFAEIERAILDYVKKIKENRLEISDLEGGTFTISNGGVYGSLMSTPILNFPQSGILGMHKIEDRAVVVDGQIVIRPMMYVALSYDHRIIDGAQAVTFLKRVKECIENPERIMMEI